MTVLGDFLEGRFDSAAQAAQDPAYYAVSMVVCRIDAPALGADVVYVEQAMVKKLGAPYRQRIFVLSGGQPADVAASARVFELKNLSAAVGLCDAAEKPTLGPDDVVEQAGCLVQVRYVEGRITGGTSGQGCVSDLNGASYATTDMWLVADRIEIWERGYTADQVQVWGPEAGAYIFERQGR